MVSKASDTPVQIQYFSYPIMVLHLQLQVVYVLQGGCTADICFSNMASDTDNIVEIGVQLLILLD